VGGGGAGTGFQVSGTTLKGWVPGGSKWKSGSGSMSKSCYAGDCTHCGKHCEAGPRPRHSPRHPSCEPSLLASSATQCYDLANLTSRIRWPAAQSAGKQAQCSELLFIFLSFHAWLRWLCGQPVRCSPRSFNFKLHLLSPLHRFLLAHCPPHPRLVRYASLLDHSLSIDKWQFRDP
jgi:hypothetical protein